MKTTRSLGAVLWWLALPASATIACGGGADSNEPGGGAGGTGGVLATGGAAGAGAAAGGSSGADSGGPTCPPPPGVPSTDAAHFVSSLVGKVVDLDGNPAKNMLSTVCGVDVCIYGSTDEQGTVVQCNPETKVCGTGISPKQALKRPAFKYGLGIQYAKFAQLLPTDKSDYDLGTLTTVLLPPFSAGVTLEAGKALMAGSATLTIPAGAEIKIDKLTYDTEETRRLRTAQIPIAKAPPAVDPALEFEMLVTTTPVDTEICPAASLEVANGLGWPAGTEVEFWVHGVSVGEEWAPYGSWAKVSGGQVSADGLKLATTAGEGVRVLGTFGIKKK